MAKKVIRNQGRKWEEGKKKGEGAAAKMTKKFEGIMTKEEASVARNEVKEGNKGERFGIFMEMQDKKLKLQEKKLEIKENVQKKKLGIETTLQDKSKQGEARANDEGGGDHGGGLAQGVLRRRVWFEKKQKEILDQDD